VIRILNKRADDVSQRQLIQWMKVALAAGKDGVERGENPFGAAICQPDGSVISATCNTVNSTHNPLAHAEVNAIIEASKKLGRFELDDCWLLSVAEPCPMCLASAAMAGISNIAFGATNVVVREAGYENLGLTGRELSAQLNREMTLHGSILGNDCIRFLLNNRRRK
jgi:tRNA(Arg) A34 adenosine deaminase TadA